MMVGRELAEEYPRRSLPPGAVRLAVRGLRRGRAVRDVSFSVRGGEILALAGLVGAGRTELLEAIGGLRPRDTRGTVRIAGEAAVIRSPHDALAAGIVLAPEDRKADGLVLGMSVAENVSLSSLDRATRFGLVSRRLERERATAAVARLAIKTPSTAQPVGTLSGGNQQKVVLAKGLACDPRVLLLDEPTRGIDIGAKREIYTLIDELARSGMAILVASSELPEILGISDRILVLAEGRVTAEFRRGAASEQTLLHAAIPTQRGVAVA
jgi:ABC-type sugar transport system ATPase subunit